MSEAYSSPATNLLSNNCGQRPPFVSKHNILRATMQFQTWVFMFLIFSTFMHAVSGTEAHPEADKVSSLPGQPHVSFQQFAGYVPVNEEQNRSLFYYFVEAEFDPDSKPLVLWLDGGPGCSSVGTGAFFEHGPFKPRGEILVRNDYSWNKEANMLYLDSPAGVGFSYSANTSFYSSVNDDVTAQDNLIFLQRWFLKFPKFKDRDLFITGESYAGHFVPQLAQLIVQSNLTFNLKGVAVGNALLEFNTDANSRDLFYWSHGLISDSTYKLLTSVCNFAQIVREKREGSLSPPCSFVNSQLSKELTDAIDPYDVTLDACLQSGQSQTETLETLNHFIRSRSQYLSALQSQPDTSNQPKLSKLTGLCIQDEINYLNRKDVQKALHAKLVGVNNWDLCTSVLQYDGQDSEMPTIHVLGSLVQSGIRVLVYNGDQDPIITFTGSRTLVNGLAKDLRLNTTVPYRAWFEGKQVGGWTQVYGNILFFVSIRGGSHFAPFTSPKRSLAVFTAFLGGSPLPDITQQ